MAGCEDGSVHCVKWESPTSCILSQEVEQVSIRRLDNEMTILMIIFIETIWHTITILSSPPCVLLACDNDCLQDPALWRDRLPQLYRMIDKTLQELLMAVFDEAKLRKKLREEQKGMRRVLDVKDASLLMAFPESEMLAVVSSEDTQYIVGCGSLGVHIGMQLY